MTQKRKPTMDFSTGPGSMMSPEKLRGLVARYGCTSLLPVPMRSATREQLIRVVREQDLIGRTWAEA